MKAISLLLLISNSAFAAQILDPTDVCKTKTAMIAVESFAHCKEGDVIQVNAYEMMSRCRLDSPIIAAGQEFVCIYRGAKRAVRERPLTASEQAFEKEQMPNLLKKYSK